MSDELLISNALLWPAADQQPIPDGRVLIRDGRIVRLGKFHARAATEIDADGGLVMPGLIQAHVHLAQTLFRGVAEDLPLLPWLRRYIWPLEAAHDDESLYVSALLACAEMLRGGVTAFLSMETTHHTGAVFAAVEQSGMMGVIGHCLMDATGNYPPLAVALDDALADCDVLLGKLGQHDRLRLALAPRFALGCAPEMMRAAAEFAREHHLRLHTHAAEQEQEVRLVRKLTGLGNIEFLHKVGLTGPDVSIAHCVHAERAEWEILAGTQTSVLHCPTTNLKLGSGVAPVPDLLVRGINVALGSDGAACNNRLDLFQEMRFAALLQKPTRGPEALPAKSVVRMATEGGARALGWEKEMGTLAVGKRANLIIVNQNKLHVAPATDPATNLVFSHEPADVELTMVNGEILYRNGEFTMLDEEQILATAREQRAKLMQRAGLT
ncbi:MAG: N-ethylammeline chlorohydrolase [Verrucomicrobia bacterium]|nr:MAG: N-ethylammeline chlorohydrolase [Verrucomicrobiota bacterium]